MSLKIPLKFPVNSYDIYNIMYGLIIVVNENVLKFLQ